jgi:uncharacterized membrane protein YozB (DUF420 family)
MNEFLHQRGFLGTSANFASDMTLACMVLAALLFTAGVVMALKKRYQVHRWIQTAAVSLNAVFVLWMMVLPFKNSVAPGIPGDLDQGFYAVASVHGLTGFAAFTFGLFVALRGNELVPRALKFSNYKLFMRISYGLYMLATLLGIWVYLTWYAGAK